MLRYRLCAIRANIADGNAALLRRDQIDIVGPCRGKADEFQLRTAFQQVAREAHFVGKYKFGIPNACRYLVIIRDVEQFELREQGLHRTDVEPGSHRGEVKKNGFHMANRFRVVQSTGR